MNSKSQLTSSKNHTSVNRSKLFAVALGLSITVTQTVQAVEKIIVSERSTQSHNQTRQSKESSAYNRTLELISQHDYNQFINYFNIATIGDFYGVVTNIQTQNRLTADGIIGDKTIEILYRRYYSQDVLNTLPETQKRVEIYNQMQGYRKYNKNLGYRGIPNVFNNDLYYGKDGGENIPGTYLNQSLYSLISQEESEKIEGNNIVIQKFNDKYILRAFIDGELKIFTFVSPGGVHYDPKKQDYRLFPSPKGAFKILDIDKYHISSSYPKKENGKNGGAKMPNAINFKNTYYRLHAGLVDGKRASHGCIRLPLLYSQGLIELTQQYPIESFNIYILDN